MTEETQGTSTAATPQLNPRQQAMASIAKQAHEQQAPDLAQFDENTGQVLSEAAQEQVVEETTEPVTEVSKPVAQTPEKRIVQIVVDGQKIDVDEEKVREAGIRTLQKESAADRRLAEANDLLKRARAQASQRDPEPAATEAPSNDVPRDTQATADDATLDQMLEQKLYNRDAVKAAAQFKREFADIASDDFLIGMAAQLEDKRLRDAAALGEPVGDPFEAYKKHGEAIRDWVKSKGMTQVQPQVNRADAKRQIVAVPGVNAKAAVSAEKKPLTVSEQIEAMRQKRGGRTVQT